MKVVRVLGLCLLFALLVGGFWLWQYNSHFHALPTTNENSDTRALLSTSLETVADVTHFKGSLAGLTHSAGPDAAYGKLKSSFAGASTSSQHLAAHLFGAALFETLGAGAVRTCDASFGFGCFHGFFSAAVSARGLEQVSALDASCVAAYGPLGTGCQHGIGHGIMEYFGPDKLSEALHACASTTQQSYLFGCTSGVFMEYNVPITVTDTSARTEPRMLDTSKPLSPCMDITSEGWRLSCLYELAQFWLQSSSFSAMGKWCAGIQPVTERAVCMYGVGNMIAVHHQYAVAEIIRECNSYALPSIRQDCKAGAAWALYADPRATSHAAEICENDKACLTRAALICNFMPNVEQKAACLESNKIVAVGVKP